MLRQLILALAVAGAAATATVPIYRQPGASVAARTADLLSRMTLEEKVAQLQNPVGAQDGPGHFSINASWILDTYGATGLGTVYGGFACNSSLSGPACVNFLQSQIIAQSRLGIPLSIIGETLVSGPGGSTIFPQPVLRGCTFDLALEAAIGRSIARQARLGGIDRGLSPVLQVDTDARFGRFEEALSESSNHVAMMGVAVATALQGDASGPNAYLPSFTEHITLEAKHYLAYGAGGRDWFGVGLDNRTLFDTYGKPWHRFLRLAGGRGVMVAHPWVNGLPLHGSKFLLTDVLRKWFGKGQGDGEEWGGLVASDWGNVNGIVPHGVAADSAHAAMLAVYAGLDNEMSPPPLTTATIAASAAAGLINMSYVDRAAANNLRQKFAAGLFDGAWFVNATALAAGQDTAADRALAYRAATEGIVLLQNFIPAGASAPLLPLAGVGTAIKTVALLGPLAGCVAGERYPCLAQQGMGGHYTNYGARVVTMLDALQNATGLTVNHLVGANIGDYNASGIAGAVAAALAADLVLVAVGDSIDISTGSCSEMSDADTTDLPGGQLALLDALAATGKPLVTLLFNCRPATFGAGPFSVYGPNNALLSRLPAVLAAFRPGEEAGNAVWDLLTGKVAPSGRLTQNWVRHSAAVKGPASPFNQVRGNLDKAYFTEPATPLFYFGFGLGYSNLTVTNVAMAPAAGTVLGPDDIVTITGAVAVAGAGPATDVSLIAYFSQNAPTKWARFEKDLCGFTRVSVPAGGATAPFALNISVRDLDAFEPDTFDFEVYTGTYTIYLATDASFSPVAAVAAAAATGNAPAVDITLGSSSNAIATFTVPVNGTYTWTWDFTH